MGPGLWHNFQFSSTLKDLPGGAYVCRSIDEAVELITEGRTRMLQYFWIPHTKLWTDTFVTFGHENCEKFELISKLTGSWIRLRRWRYRIQLPVDVAIISNFSWRRWRACPDCCVGELAGRVEKIGTSVERKIKSWAYWSNMFQMSPTTLGKKDFFIRTAILAQCQFLSADPDCSLFSLLSVPYAFNFQSISTGMGLCWSVKTIILVFRPFFKKNIFPALHVARNT